MALQVIQNFAIRRIFRLPWNYTNRLLYPKSNILSLKLRFMQLGCQQLTKAMSHNPFTIDLVREYMDSVSAIKVENKHTFMCVITGSSLSLCFKNIYFISEPHPLILYSTPWSWVRNENELYFILFSGYKYLFMKHNWASCCCALWWCWWRLLVSGGHNSGWPIFRTKWKPVQLWNVLRSMAVGNGTAVCYLALPVNHWKTNNMLNNFKY